MWTNEQKQAIDIREKNILVSASAGSGKTAVLVERVIQKVINEKVNVDKILVVTFTRAAASELKQKLVKAIEKEIKLKKENYFLKKQLDNISKATITTIDSFCLEVVRSNFFKINIDPSFSIVDNTDLLKSEAIIKVIEQEYREFDKDKFGIYNLLNLYNLKDNELMKSIINIFDYIQSFEYPFEFLKDKIQNYNISRDKDLTEYDFGIEIFKDVTNNFKLNLNTLKLLRDKFSKEGMQYIKIIDFLDDCITSIMTISNAKNFDMLYNNLNNVELPNFPRKVEGDENLIKEVKSFLTNIVRKDIKSYKNIIYANSSNIIKGLNSTYPYLEYITDLVIKFNNEFSSLKKEKNILDFSDIAHYALNILTEKVEDKYTQSDVAKEYMNKFEEVYTDEYQDTSFIQEAILNVISKDNNRFMVGDIKQSIYRFRQAMPEIFTNKYSKYPNFNITDKEDKNVKVILAKNFRSREKIIDSINYIFFKIMSDEFGDCEYKEEEALAFGANRLLEEPTNNYKTEINIIDTNKVEGSLDSIDDVTSSYINDLKNYEVECKHIALKVSNMVSNKEFKVFDEKTETFRDVRYKDIVILLRAANTKALELEKEFKEKQIPSFSDTTSNVLDNDEIRLVISMLKVIDNPYQDIDLVAIMYSSIGKFTSDEIYEIKIVDNKEYMYNNLLKYVEDNNINKKEKNNDLILKVNKLLKLIKELTDFSKSNSIAEVINNIYLDTNIYLESFLINKSKDSKINLDSLIAIAKRQDNTTIYSYINYVEELRKQSVSDAKAAKTIGENEDVVRIMSIHKSKGLEFPVVILANTSNEYNERDNSNVVTLNHKFGLGLNTINDDYNITYPSIIKMAIKLNERKLSRAEELRVLYVALTRAKEKLIIYSTVKDLSKKLNNIYIMQDDKGKIEPVCAQKNKSFADNILMSLRDNILEADVNDSLNNNFSNIFDINIYNYIDDENIGKLIKNDNTNLNIKDILENEYNSISDKEKQIVVNVSNTLKNNIEKKYKHLEDTLVATRVSVSKLKEENSNNHLDEIIKESVTEDNENNTTNESLKEVKIKYRLPKCIDNEESLSAVRKGTLIHFILQYLDFSKINSKKDLIDYINYLVDTNIITTKEKSVISVNKIYKFLNSVIGIKIKNSNNVKKEEEFVFKNLKYSKSLIQGVIDLYFENEDGSYTLLDFKTDNITDKKVFLDRYKLQLDIYKDAIENISKVNISKVYIYSFKLDDVIEVN